MKDLDHINHLSNILNELIFTSFIKGANVSHKLHRAQYVTTTLSVRLSSTFFARAVEYFLRKFWRSKMTFQFVTSLGLISGWGQTEKNLVRVEDHHFTFLMPILRSCYILSLLMQMYFYQLAYPAKWIKSLCEVFMYDLPCLANPMSLAWQKHYLFARNLNEIMQHHWGFALKSRKLCVLHIALVGVCK